VAAPELAIINAVCCASSSRRPTLPAATSAKTAERKGGDPMASRLDRRRFVLGGTSATAGALLAARNGRGLVQAQEASPAASPMASPGASPVASPTMNTEVGGQLRYLVSASAQEEIRAIQNILSTTFRERYPNLEIQVEPAASGGSGDPLLTSMVAGEAPDIFDAWTSRATPYIAAGQVLDLKPFMERDYPPEALADFFPGC
jgi:ABC-type glycerol-3-phosphate transport system substrate-binding protein